MLRFIMGALFGCFLGIIGSTFAADIVGTGKLDGWTVLDDDGDKVCTNPEVDAAKIRPRLERVDVAYGAQEGFLHEVVRTIDLATE